MAGLVLMGQYHEQISAFNTASLAKTGSSVYNGGPASILCTFPGETQHNLGYLFLIEFFVDSYIVSTPLPFPYFSPSTQKNASIHSGTSKPASLTQGPPPLAFPPSAGHRHLVRARPSKSLHRARVGALRHRLRLRRHGVGLRRRQHQHEPGPRPGHAPRRRHLLRRRGLLVPQLRVDRHPGQRAGDHLRDLLLRARAQG
ncbi:glycerol uptake facilitator, putative [Macrophomina phaseolina MS6]|uniref:Glycerol uptake facilitator, putative n=1 Tax=Macrophomina phaseolina (strain MS6) TaxID=1126212 RepID=K2QZE5_MACPH|nr:glycerol uptake facilitator, putative [Macrophomina phaseolina MS6]